MRYVVVSFGLFLLFLWVGRIGTSRLMCCRPLLFRLLSLSLRLRSAGCASAGCASAVLSLADRTSLFGRVYACFKIRIQSACLHSNQVKLSTVRSILRKSPFCRHLSLHESHLTHSVPTLALVLSDPVALSRVSATQLLRVRAILCRREFSACSWQHFRVRRRAFC